MNEAYMQALTEIDEILNFADEEMLEKIPTNFRNFVSRMKDIHYKFEYNEELPLEKQNLKSETKAILSVMYRNYWCTPEKKEMLEQQDIEELARLENEEKEKYNIDNIFKNKQKGPKTEPQMAMTIVEEKENIITKIFNAIKRFFTGK